MRADFLTHWKTRFLVDRLGSTAPLAVIALWSHCHNSREDTFSLSSHKLAAVCRWEGDAEELFKAMAEIGFIDVNEDGSITAHGWREANKAITSKWGNSHASKKRDEKTTCISMDQ